MTARDRNGRDVPTEERRRHTAPWALPPVRGQQKPPAAVPLERPHEEAQWAVEKRERLARPAAGARPGEAAWARPPAAPSRPQDQRDAAPSTTPLVGLPAPQDPYAMPAGSARRTVNKPRVPAPLIEAAAALVLVGAVLLGVLSRDEEPGITAGVPSTTATSSPTAEPTLAPEGDAAAVADAAARRRVQARERAERRRRAAARRRRAAQRRAAVPAASAAPTATPAPIATAAPAPRPRPRRSAPERDTEPQREEMRDPAGRVPEPTPTP